MEFIVKKTTGQILFQLRKSAGLSQEEAADLAGVARSTLAGYETDARRPKYAALEKLASFYGVSIPYLMGESEDTGAEEHISGDKLILLQSIKGMTDEEARQARAVIEALRRTSYGD